MVKVLFVDISLALINKVKCVRMGERSWLSSHPGQLCLVIPLLGWHSEYWQCTGTLLEKM